MKLFKLIMLILVLIGSTTTLPMHKEIASNLTRTSSITTKINKLKSKIFFITPSRFSLYLAAIGITGFCTGIGLGLHTLKKRNATIDRLNFHVAEMKRHYNNLKTELGLCRNDSKLVKSQQDHSVKSEKLNFNNPNFGECHRSQQNKENEPVN